MPRPVCEEFHLNPSSPSGPDPDLIVVGAGGAGLAAAVAAAQAGARVLVLEKLAGLAGTTSRSVGSFAAAGTRLQRAAGIRDNAQDFAEDIVLACSETAEPADVRHMLAREAAPTLDWLESMGLVLVGPFPEPPNRVPRMHNAVPAGMSYLKVLHKAALGAGVELRFGCRVAELLRGPTGIAGVSYRQDGAQKQVRARLGVILAAGDFSADTGLRERFLAAPAVAAVPINPQSTGDGHRMAMEAGAQMRRMDAVFGPQLRFPPPAAAPWFHRLPHWRWLLRIAAAYVAHMPKAMIAPFVRQLLVAHMSPAQGLFDAGCVLVDSTGRRLGEAGRAVDELAVAPGGAGYVIGDRRIADRFRAYPYFISTAPGVAYAYFQDYERGRPDLVRWAPDRAALARALGLDADLLAHSAAGLQGELFALGPVQAMLTVTEGGARIDTSCRVLDESDRPIPGLYAVGAVGQSGLLLKGHGLHLAWAMTSGRVAGLAAAGARPEPAAG